MPHTLLLADDSPTIHRVIELTFADEDISVVAVDDGDKAIAALDRVPPDIVLADIGMPGRSGYEVARHVKETPQLAHIPVLLLTGAFEPVDPAAVTAMQCEGVLTKPFDPGALVRRVRELLESPRQPAVSEPAAPAAEPRPVVAVAADPTLPVAPISPSAFGSLRAVEPPSIEPLVAPETESTMPTNPRTGPFPPKSPTRPDNDVESYFQELDHAFATLSSSDREVLPALDRFVREPLPAREPDPPPAVAPAVTPAPAPAVTPGPAAVVPPGSAPGVGPAPAPSAPRAPVGLLDAFSALLSAEGGGSGPRVKPLRPEAVPSSATPVPEVSTDEIVERAARRALEALPEDAIRRIVEDVVSASAERLILDEIDRIKRNIK